MQYDIVSEADTGKKYCRKFILWPKYWKRYPAKANLSWQFIRYTRAEINNLPEKPGVYAFVVKPGIAGLTECNYLLYVGKAKEQSLKVRCKQYLDELNKKKPRIFIAQMFNLWKDHLFLYYSELDSSKVNISDIENNLLLSFLPPLNQIFPGKLTSIAKDIYHS